MRRRILDRYLLEELTKTFLAVFVVLILITFGAQITELLTKAFEGVVPPFLVGKLLLYKLPSALPVIMPLAILLAVMLTFGRLYQDQEMIVLLSCGIPPAYFLKLLSVWVLPWMLLGGYVAGWLAPISEKKARLIQIHAQETSPFAAMQAGRFNPIGDHGIFYVAEKADNQVLKDVWIRYPGKSGWIIVSAPYGKFSWVGERLALVLQDAWMVENRQSDTFSLRHFENFKGFIPELSVKKPLPTIYEYTLPELLSHPDNKLFAFANKMLILPLTVLVIAIAGYYLSRSKPRENRFSKLFFALVLYVVYFQFQELLLDRVIKGEKIFVAILWSIPIVFLLIVFWKNNRKVK